MKKLILLALLPLNVMAAPFFVADLPDQTTTHCQFQLNGGAWSLDMPVIGTLRICFVDANALNVQPGPNTLLARAVKVDAGWGRLESAPSAPFSFTRPAAPSTPSTPRLTAVAP